MAAGQRQITVGTVKAVTDKLLQWKKNNSSVLSEFDIQMNIQRLANILNLVILKGEKETTNYVFCGTTSSGKSLTINSLLQMNLMKSTTGDTTPTAVLIQSTKSESYIEYKGSGKKPFRNLTSDEGLKEFHKIVNKNSKGFVQSTDCLHVFVSEENLRMDSMLSDKVTILDTPGMGRNIFDSKEVKHKICEADALILVVDMVSWLDKKTLNVLKDQNFFVKPNVIFAVNKYDELYGVEDDDESREIKKENITNDILDMVEHSQITQEDVRKSIFFISSRVAWKVMNSKNSLELKPEDSAMMEEFTAFKRAVMSLAEENRKKKKEERIKEAVVRYIEQLKQKVSNMKSEVGKVKTYINMIMNKLEGSKNSLRQILNLQLVKEAYDNHFKELIGKSGQDKVVMFLAHCRDKSVRSRIFEEVKRALIGTLLVKKMEALSCRMLDEEIKKIFDKSKEEQYIQLYSQRLDPDNMEDSQNARIREIENEIEALSNTDEEYLEIEAQYQSEEDRYEELRDILLKNIFNDIRQEGTDALNRRTVKRLTKAISNQNIVSLSGKSASSFGGILNSLLFSKSPTSVIGGIGLGLVGIASIITEMIKNESDREKIIDLQIDRIRKEKEKKKNDLILEKQENLFELENELETISRREHEEHQRKLKECHSRYQETLIDLYAHCIECVSANVQQRLRDKMNEMDTMIKKCLEITSVLK